MSDEETHEQIAQSLMMVAADHPCWIGDDGEPLDYLPKREERIWAMCREQAAALAPLLDAARREGARAGAATCICSEDAYNAVGCSCHAEERRAYLATYDPWGRAAAAASPDTESEER